MNDKTIDTEGVLTIAFGVLLGVGVTLGQILYEDRQVSARRASGALILTSTVNFVWLTMALNTWHLHFGYCLAGSLALSAIGGYSIIRLGGELAEAAAKKKAGAVLGLTHEEIAEAARIARARTQQAERKPRQPRAPRKKTAPAVSSETQEGQ